MLRTAPKATLLAGPAAASTELRPAARPGAAVMLGHGTPGSHSGLAKQCIATTGVRQLRKKNMYELQTGIHLPLEKKPADS